MFEEKFQVVNVRGHYEIFKCGVFQFSADTISEALQEIAKEEGEEGND